MKVIVRMTRTPAGLPLVQVWTPGATNWSSERSSRTGLYPPYHLIRKLLSDGPVGLTSTKALKV